METINGFTLTKSQIAHYINLCKGQGLTKKQTRSYFSDKLGVILK